MKIYCNRHELEFEDFVGRDIWVKCELTVSSIVIYSYLKVLKIYRDIDKMKYLAIPEKYIDTERRINTYDLMWYDKYLFKQIDDTQCSESNKSIYNISNISHWRIVTPLDTYTTEEIKAIMHHIESY